MNEEITIFFPRFHYKKYMKRLEGYAKHLRISTEGEMYVLQHILDRDFGRDLILIDIEKIELEHGLITVKCTTKNGSYWFSVSDLESKGWYAENGVEPSRSFKEGYISKDLYHKMD